MASLMMLGVAHELGWEVEGEEHWKTAFGLAMVLAPQKVEHLVDRLACTPADAVEQIVKLKAEIERLKDELDSR